MAEVRLEYNLPAFAEIRWEFMGECSAIGHELAGRANAAAETHDIGGRPEGPGTYDSKDFGGPVRPFTVVRVADARGALDEALHGTLSEVVYGMKGRKL